MFSIEIVLKRFTLLFPYNPLSYSPNIPSHLPTLKLLASFPLMLFLYTIHICLYVYVPMRKHNVLSPFCCCVYIFQGRPLCIEPNEGAPFLGEANSPLSRCGTPWKLPPFMLICPLIAIVCVVISRPNSFTTEFLVFWLLQSFFLLFSDVLWAIQSELLIQTYLLTWALYDLLVSELWPIAVFCDSLHLLYGEASVWIKDKIWNLVENYFGLAMWWLMPMASLNMGNWLVFSGFSPVEWVWSPVRQLLVATHMQGPLIALTEILLWWSLLWFTGVTSG